MTEFFFNLFNAIQEVISMRKTVKDHQSLILTNFIL